MSELGIRSYNGGLQITNLPALSATLARNPKELRAYIRDQYMEYTLGRGVDGIGGRFQFVKNFLSGARFPAGTPQAQIYAIAREEVAKLERDYNAQSQIRGTQYATTEEARRAPQPAPVKAPVRTTERRAPTEPPKPKLQYKAEDEQAQIAAQALQQGGLAALQGKRLSPIDGKRGGLTNGADALALGKTTAELARMSPKQINAAYAELSKKEPYRTALLRGLEQMAAGHPDQYAKFMKGQGIAETGLAALDKYRQNIGAPAAAPIALASANNDGSAQILNANASVGQDARTMGKITNAMEFMSGQSGFDSSVGIVLNVDGKNLVHAYKDADGALHVTAFDPKKVDPHGVEVRAAAQTPSSFRATLLNQEPSPFISEATVASLASDSRANRRLMNADDARPQYAHMFNRAANPGAVSAEPAARYQNALFESATRRTTFTTGMGNP